MNGYCSFIRVANVDTQNHEQRSDYIRGLPKLREQDITDPGKLKPNRSGYDCLSAINLECGRGYMSGVPGYISLHPRCRGDGYGHGYTWHS